MAYPAFVKTKIESKAVWCIVGMLLSYKKNRLSFPSFFYFRITKFLITFNHTMKEI